jgi:hypothetical protein
MRSTRCLLLAVATAATVALTGCSATVTGSAAPTGGAPVAATDAAAAGGAATSDPVAWTDKLCGSLLPSVKALSTSPQVDQNDPGATVKALSGYFGTAVSSLDQTLKGLDAAGPSPIANGDAVVVKLKQTLGSVRTSFNNAKAAIDKVDPNNISDIATALPEALAPLQNLQSLDDPSTDIQSNPALEAAAAKAPNCQEINKLG